MKKSLLVIAAILICVFFVIGCESENKSTKIMAISEHYPEYTFKLTYDATTYKAKDDYYIKVKKYVSVIDMTTGISQPSYDYILFVPAPGILQNDLVGNNLVVSWLVKNPMHGAVILFKDGAFSYNPYRDYSGIDYFTYQACDIIACYPPATVTLTITTD